MSAWIDRQPHLGWLFAALAALVAAWMVGQNHGVINPDGVLYVEVAQLLASGAWSAAFERFNWPFYSGLMAAVHQLTGLSLQHAAHLLAVVFFALTAAGLLALVREAGGDRRVQTAAGLLLFASIYIVDTALPMVVRDQGFWAAHLWSLVFFLRFYRQPAWSAALAWGVAAVLAVLFRIEAITYLAALPLVLLARRDLPPAQRLAALLQANVLLGLGALAVLLALLFTPGLQLHELGRLGDPWRIAGKVYHEVTQGLAGKAEVYGSEVLGSFLDDYALAGLWLTLLLVVLAKAVTSAGWLQLVCTLYALRLGDAAARPRFAPVWGWLALLGLANALAVILSRFVLQGRYILPLAFILILYGAFGLAALHARWQQRRRQADRRAWLYPAALALLTAQLLVALWPTDPRSAYEVEAARWLEANAAPGSRIYFDAGRVRYYMNGDASDRTTHEWDMVQQQFAAENLRRYDYLLAHVSRKKPEREAALVELAGAAPVAEFRNHIGDKLLVFRPPH